MAAGIGTLATVSYGGDAPRKSGEGDFRRGSVLNIEKIKNAETNPIQTRMSLLRLELETEILPDKLSPVAGNLISYLSAPADKGDIL